MKSFKKFIACMCALALIVSGIVYSPAKDVKAQTYDSLEYTTLNSGIAYNYISNAISANNPEVLDNGTTMQFAYSADNKKADTVITINGVTVPNGTGAVTYVDNGITKINPTLLEDNAYTLVVISTTTGSLEVVVRRGTPTNGGEIVTTTSSSGQQTTTGSAINPTTQAPTANVPDATTTPKQVQGVVAQTEVGESTIDNSVMIAWASSTDANNAAGYDPTVTSYNIYIYKNGQQMTHIVNATNGGVVGGLSTGSYQAAVVAVNSMGEGTPSEKIDFTVTGSTLNYTYPAECNGPKTPGGLVIITANPEVQPSAGNETNAIEVAWAASSNVQASSYDSTVTGYNIYLFDAVTGNPYRRVHVDGITETYTAIKSVSAGTYLVYLSAINAKGEESALSAPGISLPSKVTVTGETYDNAQDFNQPDQPALPVGLEIITEGIQYGFTIAWAANADLTGVRLNLYVDGVCVKSGINAGGSSYYENRVAAGTYNIEVKAQYTSNNVESFPLTKTGVTIAADPGIETKTPAELADPNYSGYEKPTDVPTTAPSVDNPTVAPTVAPTDKPTVAPTDKPTDPTVSPTNKPVETTAAPTTKPSGSVVTPTTKNEETTKAPNIAKPGVTTKAPNVGKTKVKKATKKKSAKNVKISIKKIKDAKNYQVQISKKKKFNKKNILVKKTVNKVKFTIKNKKLKNKKKLFVRVRACKVVNGKKYYGAWSNTKKIKIK